MRQTDNEKTVKSAWFLHYFLPVSLSLSFAFLFFPSNPTLLAQISTRHLPFQTPDSLNPFTYPPALNQDRLRGLTFTGASGYVSTMVGLNELWYKDFPRARFHFFNDNGEWFQVDKAGHGMTSYYIGKLGMDALKWSGLPVNKAMWYGGTFGLVFLSTFELFDGLSAQWGASPGDIAANTAGVAFLIAQESVWKEQRMLLKFSFSPTTHAQKRPDILGSNFQEQALKNYNGQTYWLSVNLASFLNHETKIPRWLNAAVGYGADGMLGGKENPLTDNNGNIFPVFKRERQFYLSLDIDLTRLKPKSKFLRAFFNGFGFIKFPAPALELSGKKFKFQPLYF